MEKKIYLTLLFLFFISGSLFSQDFGFGFGFNDDEEESSPPPPVTFSLGGEAAIEFPFYLQDYEFLWEEILPSAKFHLTLSSKYIDAVTSFIISYNSISEFWDKDADWGKANFTPRFIDEAFLRAYLGPVNIEAGLRKLTWGRADSSGPLDVTNPVDFSDLRNITDIKAQKIARLMLRTTWNIGSFSKIEGVFIPNFAGHRFAQEGRWTPSQFSTMPVVAGQGIFNRALEKYPAYSVLIQQMYPQLAGQLSGFSVDFPDTSCIENFQTGLRFNTTIGPADFGGQYFYGTLFRPGFTIAGVDAFIDDLLYGNILSPPYYGDFTLLSPQLKYTRYHQFGIDYAQVLFKFNIRAEFAFNLTEDYDGSDGSLQNPFIAWSFGFDRDLFWGINLNIQCNETIRLFNSKVGSNPVFDAEAGTPVTNTRLTTQLSKKFFRDNLETKAVVIWDIENMDCYIIPSVTYIFRDITFNLTAGFFAGDKDGELGQYHKNNFIRLGVKYQF